MKSRIPHDRCKGILHNIMESDPLFTLGGVTKKKRLPNVASTTKKYNLEISCINTK